MLKRKRQLYFLFEMLILLINGLHAYWFLAFTSLIWFFFFKITLVIFCSIAFFKEKIRYKISIILYRILILLFFGSLLGINKWNVKIGLFPSKYELIQICTTDKLKLPAVWQQNRMEHFKMDYGLYNSIQKKEIVYPLFLMFEWRKNIKNDTTYKSIYQNCHFLGKDYP